jgi:protein transport protein SEC24
MSNASAQYTTCTLKSIPSTSALLDRSKLPFGLLISPFHQLAPGEEEIPLIQSPQIVRCRRCRTYINPWITFIEQGTRWKCNMCSLSNDGTLYLI